MVIYFDNRATAEAHLLSRGFRRIKTGAWAKDGIRATIHPCIGQAAVSIGFSEVEG